MDSFGDYLKSEREVRSVTLEEIAGATKISISMLRAIEQGKEDKLLAPVFVRGFVRCYAKYLGLDENDAILRYQRQIGRSEIPEVKETPPPEERSPRPKLNKRILWASAAIACIVAGLGVVIYTVQEPSREPSHIPDRKQQIPSPPQLPAGAVPVTPPSPVTAVPSDTTAGTAAPAVEPASPTESPAQTPQTREPNEEQVADGEKHVLQGIFKEDTWIQRMTPQGAQEYSFKAGETFTWTVDKGIRLLVGNAGGVEFSFDRKPVKSLGKSGQVVSVTFPGPARM
ncbi:MAG: RodZ domain-containing protein [Pseudomonadota bacterium]